MKLKHEKSLLLPEPNLIVSRIECITYSPNTTKLAVCAYGNNHIILFDGTTNEKKDKFALKAVEKNFSRKSFSVKGISFSPDSLRLAIGQTDSVIYVYKIGENWGDKKSIVGKYTLQNPVTCLIWHEFGIVFGSSDGKVKIVNTQTNKMLSLLSNNTMTISLSICGDNVIGGFLSGMVMMNSLYSRDGVGRQIITHSCPPFALTLSQSGYLCAGGSDGRVIFVNVTSGSSTNSGVINKQSVEIGSDIGNAMSSPSGNVIVLSSLYKLLIFELETRVWKQTNVIELNGAFLITGMHWSKDGTKLVVGTVNGALELFGCKWKRKVIGERLEINYVGNKQVVIRDLSKGNSAVFSSIYDIRDVKIYHDNYAVIWTNKSIIIGDIQNPDDRISEIDWTGMTTEGVKFSFDYENVALINVIGELYLIELGTDQFIASVRTDFVNPHLMSVRVNERKSGVKVFAYLLDLKTISIIDLIAGIQLCSWSHANNIDWIELNETGKRLIFRDKSLRLHLLDILTQDSKVLLNFCGFVQWVPGSDVIVAQSKEKLYIWYDFDKPVIHEITGGTRNEAIGIERDGGITKVMFTNPSTEIILDEVLLEFDTAIEDGDLERAVSFLESCGPSAESESMWRILGNEALKASNLLIAERSFAAVGDVAKAALIRECDDEPNKIPLLENKWDVFESIGEFSEIIETYTKLHKWEKAIDFAKRCGRIEIKDDLEKEYYQWLLDTGQEAEAGNIMEKLGKIEEAIKLYLKSGRAVKASKIIINRINRRDFDISKSVIEQVIRELSSGEFYEEAGQLFELNIINDKSSALESYIKGNAYTRAIELARREFPDEVVTLESKFAEWLITESHNYEAAVSHFIEAGKTDRALEAAIHAGQYERAAEIAAILENIPPNYGKKIANHYALKDQIDTAVEIYINCGCIRDAVSLLNNHGQFARAYKLARKLMDPSEAKEMYASIAKLLENDGKYKEAERIYITCDDADSAISMYKNSRQYDAMIRLVKQYHPDLLNDTHLHLAKELEAERSYHQAETHYVAISEWKMAVQMYKNAGQWEEAYRVARAHGGATAAKQVAYLWGTSLNNAEAAVKLLSRYGLLNQVVDYAVEINAFEFAKDLISNSGSELKHKMNEVKLKYAIWLEDEGRYGEAESMFIESGKPKEAVLMYLHNSNFNDALRIAEDHVPDEECARDVLTAQAKSILGKGNGNLDDMYKAESLLLRAGRIEIAVKIYKENGMWDEALRVAEQYAHNLVDPIKREMILESRNSGRYMNESETRGNSGRSINRISESDKRDQKDMAAYNDITDYKQLLTLAEQNGDRESIAKYTLLLASQMIRDKSLKESLKLLSKNNSVSMLPETKKIVIRIAADLFSFESNYEPDLNTWKLLRECLYQVIGSSGSNAELEIVEKYLLITHLYLLRTILSNLNSNATAIELYTKITISLLRYTDIIRVDKSFYDAGRVAKESSRLEMAFVFWNHFLDIVEAIEEGHYNVDHSDFVGTDIPFEVPLPSQPFFVESAPNIIEDVKSWILQISMDSHVAQSLPLDPLRDGDIYEASLINSDSTMSLPCLVSGYPVIRHKMLEFKQGKYAVNKDDWNKLLMLTKVTNNEELKEFLHFIGKLCGNATVARFSFQ